MSVDQPMLDDNMGRMLSYAFAKVGDHKTGSVDEVGTGDRADRVRWEEFIEEMLRYALSVPNVLGAFCSALGGQEHTCSNEHEVQPKAQAADSQEIPDLDFTCATTKKRVELKVSQAMTSAQLKSEYWLESSWILAPTHSAKQIQTKIRDEGAKQVGHWPEVLTFNELVNRVPACAGTSDANLLATICANGENTGWRTLNVGGALTESALKGMVPSEDALAAVNGILEGLTSDAPDATDWKFSLRQSALYRLRDGWRLDFDATVDDVGQPFWFNQDGKGWIRAPYAIEHDGKKERKISCVSFGDAMVKLKAEVGTHACEPGDTASGNLAKEVNALIDSLTSLGEMLRLLETAVPDPGRLADLQKDLERIDCQCANPAEDLGKAIQDASESATYLSHFCAKVTDEDFVVTKVYPGLMNLANAIDQAVFFFDQAVGDGSRKLGDGTVEKNELSFVATRGSEELKIAIESTEGQQDALSWYTNGHQEPRATRDASLAEWVKSVSAAVEAS